MQKLRDLLPDHNKKIEQEMLTKGVGKMRSQIESAKNRNSETETCYGQRLLREAVPSLVTGIEEWFSQQKKSPCPSNAYTELSKLSPKVSAFIVLKSVLDTLTQRRPLASSAIRVGALIEDELHFGAFSEHPNFSQILQGADKRPSYAKKRYYLIHSEKGEVEQGNAEPWDKWGTRIKLHVGTVLITLVKEYTGLLDYVMIQTDKRGPARFIQATKKTQEWVEDMIKYNEGLDPFWMPLKDYPKQWDNKWSGGYEIENGLPPVSIIKTKDKAFMRKNDEPMTEVMTCLNNLQNTGWKINGQVHQALNDIWQDNIKIGSLPAQQDEELPPLSEEEKEDPELLRNWKRRASAVYEYNASTKSRRLLVLNTLAMAKKYADTRFYLPHQCDFRGRAYAIPAYLNHMGADFNKGLLHFDNGQQVSKPDDLQWLHIHGANAFGIKGTYAQRIAWAEENQSKILRLANNFKSELDMLNEAGETFQFLAYCYEVAKLHKEGSQFVTHLPCQMDGTNNGLQILGLLTRDIESCEATNVAPTNYPMDIYQIVADKAISYLREDDNPFANLWLQFGVTRSCSKRPTMTQPYGSTPHSCRNYVNGWYLETVRAGHPDPFDETNRFQATAYLSTQIWRAINEVVGKPREAMAWLQKSARTLAKFERPMYWVSPSGFPCYQAYPKWVEKSIRTRIGEKVYRVKFRQDIDKLSPKRQAQGSSPNYVHSLDASCLHLTVNKCAELGIKDFAMVHDSYGTHCNNSAAMATSIRETVHEIFSVDQLAYLKYNLECTNRLTLDPLPSYGAFNIDDVLKSQYIFS
jgi:DNA-directed RNA polymerase